MYHLYDIDDQLLFSSDELTKVKNWAQEEFGSRITIEEEDPDWPALPEDGLCVWDVNEDLIANIKET